MHNWDDDWPYWNELYAAQNYIIEYVYKHSFCTLWCKEKWGTLRYEHIFAPWSTKLRIALPFWKRKITLGDKTLYLNRWILFWDTSWLYRKWCAYGAKQLRIAVKKACTLYPNVQKEIRADLKWR